MTPRKKLATAPSQTEDVPFEYEQDEADKEPLWYAPPTDTVAEASLVGAMYLDPTCIGQVCGIVNEKDFYYLPHKHVFEVLSSMSTDEAQPVVDPVVVVDRLHELYPENYSRSIARHVMAMIGDACPVATNAVHYAGVVRRISRERMMAQTASLLLTKGTVGDGTINMPNWIETMSGVMDAYLQHTDAYEADVSKLSESLGLEIRDTAHNPGFSTGFPSIDKVVPRGIQPQNVFMVAARSGVGKSWIQCHLVINALKSGRAVLFPSLEMPKEEVLLRIFSLLECIPTQELEERVLNGYDLADIVKRHPYLHNLALTDRCDSIRDIRAALHKKRAMGMPISCVFIDYLQLLSSDLARGASTYEKTSNVATSLKSFARRERVALVLAVQLSRRGGAGDIEPTLDMLRDSGAIEECADRILFAWAPGKSAGLDRLQRATMSNRLELKLEKNRQGKDNIRASLEVSEWCGMREVPDMAQTYMSPPLDA